MNEKIIKNLDGIVPRDVDFAQWYTSIINQAKLIQYTDVKGFMIFQPNGWGIWENIRNLLDLEFKKMGIKNVYMPLLIPYSDFQKEKDHVEGFAPELFMVESIGKKKLEEPLAIRPTSEILFCKYFANIVKSYKDLPIKVNQWTSVLRAEKTTRPFLRNSEFHWHETHAVFASKDHAHEFTIQFLNLYKKFVEDQLCIPVVDGEKTPGERFAGADHTYTIETMMQDGQALQSATSHLLGQNFAKAYDIKYQNKENGFSVPYSTSHGLSTRIIGALIMVHADDKGLVLPPAVAPTQISFLPLFVNKNPEILEHAHALMQKFSHYRTYLDDTDRGVGAKLADQEIQGTPLSIILGPKDLQENMVTIFRRDLNTKENVAITDLDAKVKSLLEEYKVNLFKKAKDHLDQSIVWCDSLEQLKEILEEKKWAKAYFSGSIEDEKKIKELTGATPRCIIEHTQEAHPCFYTKKESHQVVIFARAY